MKWTKKKGIGNLIESYELSHNDVRLCTIQVFTNGLYSLPENWFPRKGKKYMLQMTRDLDKAKKKCEKWILDFAQSLLKK